MFSSVDRKRRRPWILDETRGRTFRADGVQWDRDWHRDTEEGHFNGTTWTGLR